MDVQLNEFQTALQSSVRQFVNQEVIPVASEYEHKDEYPHPLVNRMKELGYFGALVPECYGGSEMDAMSFTVLTEELARGWMSLTGVLGGHSMVGWMINEFGNDEQRQEWLPEVAEGKMRFGIGITEADGGSDVAALRTSARREGQDYIVNGSKMFITNSENATHFAIMARTNPKAEKPTRGISCILMDRNLPGFSASRHLDKMGYKGLRTGELVFDDCPVPASYLIGEENRGFHQLMAALELGRIQVAARAVGLHAACFEDSIKYAQQRKSMGKPIAEYQAIQIKLADMATLPRSGPPAHLPRGAHERPGRAVRPRGRHGETLRLRRLPEGVRGGRSRSRGVRLHQGAAGRALLPRFHSPAGGGGHERHSAHRHCEATGGEIPRLNFT